MKPTRSKIFRAIRTLVFAATIALIPVSTAAAQDETGPVTLKECWRYTSAMPLAGNLSFADDQNIYVAETDGRLSALSAANGQRIWSSELGGSLISNITGSGGRIYVMTGIDAGNGKLSGTRLREISVTTGVPVAELQLSVKAEAVIMPAGRDILMVSAGGDAALVRTEQLAVNWQKSFSPLPLSSVVVSGNEVAFSQPADKVIRVLSISDGSLRQLIQTFHSPAALLIDEETLVWGDVRGNLYSYDRGKGEVNWKFKNGAKITSLYPHDGQVIAASMDNFVYSITVDSGHVTWKRRLSARLTYPLLIDGNVGIVITFGETTAAFIDMRNGKPRGQLAVGEKEIFIHPPLAVAGAFAFVTSRSVSLHRRDGCKN